MASPHWGASGFGTIFEIDPNTCVENILHSFCGEQNCTDGATPASLIGATGALFGTTVNGGTYQLGTAFSINPKTGAAKVLHAFGTGADGSAPVAMIDLSGTLYGTTEMGGATGNGTVFSPDEKTGAEKVLYSFCSRQGCIDGSYPLAGLVNVSGMLYGTTVEGGSSGCNGDGCGAAFSFAPKTRAEKVVYAFCHQKNCTDGTNPYAGLTNVNGTIYGTTDGGGAHNGGTVFALKSP